MFSVGPEPKRLSPDRAAPQQTVTQSQDQHPEIVLGQTVAPLVSHHTGVSPPHPVSLTITQPQSLRQGFCGQTRKLFSSEPIARREDEQLKLEEATTVNRPGFVQTECIIRNLHQNSPLLDALRIRLGSEFTTRIDDNGMAIVATLTLGAFIEKTNLLQFCAFVEGLRS